MKITLAETLKLDIFKGFRLLVGEEGLKRFVTRIGLLDHEMINPIKGQFVEGEFALSTLLAAKDNPELILTSVKYLIESGASGLGVKDIYYKELPKEALALAKLHDFPIFIFDNSVYFEDIITEFKSFKDTMKREASSSNLLEHLMNGAKDEEEIQTGFFELIGHYKGSYEAVHLRMSDVEDSDAYLALKGHRLTKRLSILFSGIYNNGLFIIKNNEEDVSLENLLVQEGFGEEDIYHYGVSQGYNHPKYFKQALEEALVNARIGEIEGLKVMCSEDRGLYQLLLAYGSQDQFQQYKEKLIRPILTYDENNNTNLMETAIAFVRNEGTVKGAAKSLVQHDNTVRYRLSKIRQLLGITASDSVLYEHLSLVIRLYLLEQLTY